MLAVVAKEGQYGESEWMKVGVMVKRVRNCSTVSGTMLRMV